MQPDPRVQDLVARLVSFGITHQRSKQEGWCVPASVSMLASAYGITLSQEEIAAIGHSANDGTSRSAIPHVTKKAGFLTVEFRAPSLETVFSLLESRRPLIAIVDKNGTAQTHRVGDPYTSHATVFGGYAPQQRGILLYDPDQQNPTLIYDERLRAEWPHVLAIHAPIGSL